jgi:type II secretory pathway pseudopilin PulG
MRREAAMTLIEVMVALTISLVLVGLAWGGFQQLRRTVAASRAAADLALEAAWLARRLGEDAQNTQQTAQMRLETPLLDAAIYGPDVRAVRLMAVRELAARDGSDLPDGTPTGRQPLVWYAWEWRPPTLAQLAIDPRASGRLYTGQSTPERSTVQGWTTGATPVARPLGVVDIDALVQVAQPRRSRFADPEESDFRHVPGLADLEAAIGGRLRLAGDRSDVLGEDGDRDGVIDPGEDHDGDGRLRQGTLNRASGRVVTCALSWVDAGGFTTTATMAGVTVLDASGTIVTQPGQPWWNAYCRAIDGLWRDARTNDGDAVAGVARSTQAWRPSLLRFAITLREGVIDKPYVFCIPLALESPVTHGL